MSTSRNFLYLAFLCAVSGSAACGSDAGAGADAGPADANATGADSSVGLTPDGAAGADVGATSGEDATASNDDGGGTAGLAPGTCSAISSGASDCVMNALPPQLYLCAMGGPPPEMGCSHPPMTAANADIKYCCPDALCTRQATIDYLCASKPATPKAVHCAADAVTPAGCVLSGSQIVNHCCP
jgi:hypothetical protein